MHCLGNSWPLTEGADIQTHGANSGFQPVSCLDSHGRSKKSRQGQDLGKSRTAANRPVRVVVVPATAGAPLPLAITVGPSRVPPLIALYSVKITRPSSADSYTRHDRLS